MKQFITLLAATVCFATAVNANPIPSGKKANRFEEYKGNNNNLKVFANPKTGNATVSFLSEKTGKGMIVVLDEAGNTVLRQSVKLAEGRNRINISNFSNLQEGYYTVCLNTSHKSYSAPFLLWK